MTTTATKETILIIIAALFSVVNFLIFSAVATLHPTGAVTALLIILNTLWLVVIALAMFLSRSLWSKAALTIVPSFAVTLAGAGAAGALGGAFLLLVSLLVGLRSIKREAANRINYTTWYMFGPGLRIIVIGLILALAGLLLPELRQVIAQDGLQISEQQTAAIIKPIQPLLKDYLPTTDTNANIDDLIDAQVKQQTGGAITAADISDEQRAEIKQQISRQFNQPITGQETLASVVTTRVNNTLRNLTQNNALLVALVIIVLAFLTLRALVPIVVWVLLLLMIIVVYLTRKTGLAKLEEQQITSHRLTL
ncbi:MAG: hypothetical protein Q8P73_03930 [bacterium]|nr:hypothetical protein [bacterium]MDZ4345812.1 hypothetical protein [Candidatus Binatia bacterium]